MKYFDLFHGLRYSTNCNSVSCVSGFYLFMFTFFFFFFERKGVALSHGAHNKLAYVACCTCICNVQ